MLIAIRREQVASVCGHVVGQRQPEPPAREGQVLPALGRRREPPCLRAAGGLGVNLLWALSGALSLPYRNSAAAESRQLLLGKLPAMPAKLPAMLGKLPAMQAKIPAMMAKLPAMLGKIPAMLGKLLSMQAKISAMLGKIPAMPAKLPAMQAKLPAMPAKIPAMLGKIPASFSQAGGVPVPLQSPGEELARPGRGTSSLPAEFSFQKAVLL